jgi:hypothetical protein
MNGDAPTSRWPACLGAVIGLITIIAAGVTLLTLAADAQSDLEKQGEALINARCIACHSTKSLIKFVARCAEQRGDAYLDSFLTRHHAPDENARTAIIAYLTCQLDDAVP